MKLTLEVVPELEGKGRAVLGDVDDVQDSVFNVQEVVVHDTPNSDFIFTQ